MDDIDKDDGGLETRVYHKFIKRNRNRKSDSYRNLFNLFTS